MLLTVFAFEKEVVSNNNVPRAVSFRNSTKVVAHFVSCGLRTKRKPILLTRGKSSRVFLPRSVLSRMSDKIAAKGC